MSAVRIFAIVTAIFLVTMTASVQGETLTFELSIEISGATPPDGPTPWLTATFDDGGTAGSVDLTLETTNLVEVEHVKVWLFNLNPAFDAADLASLTFTETDRTGTFGVPTISKAIDGFPADGDGYFDIEIALAQPASPHFGVGDKVEYTITGIGSLTAGSFNFVSTPDGSPGIFTTAAHVGSTGIDDEQSGWISVPEPSSFFLLCMGAFGVLVSARRWRK